MQEANKITGVFLIILFKIPCITVLKLMQANLSLRKHLGEDYTLEKSPNLSGKQLHICQQAFATEIAIAIKETNLQNLINTSISLPSSH